MKDLKIFTNNIEDNAKEQIDTLLKQEAFKDSKIRIMPDVHSGIGCVIGFTGDLGDKVIPNIVGVDIGCGILCVELGNIDIDFEKLDNFIKENIPSGREVYKGRIKRFDLTLLKCNRTLKDTKRLERSLGTLGGGNHFIEIDIDDNNNKYLVIHTGSRNLGKQVAEIYQKKAIGLCNFNEEEFDIEKDKIIKYYKTTGQKDKIQTEITKLAEKYKEKKNNIPDELAYLEGEYKERYLHDMKLCQEFAVENRRLIAERILKHLSLVLDNCNYFESIHNYISFEDNIVRKGAISARKGEKVIIPMNMRDGCIIGVGKGNEDWNFSAPHGAGRVMSRKQALEKVNIDDYKKSMNGIFTTSINDFTKDEAPMVYKRPEEIIENITDTVEITKIIKPIYNFKANN